MGIEVVVEGLTKSFGKQNIWQDVSLTLPAGEVSVMLGPSGTGKTVFLKSIIGLLKPEQGRVLINGVDMVNSSERDIMETRKLFGLMFQDGALFGSMSLFDNIAFPLREHTRKKESEIRRIVMERIDIVGLLGAEESCRARYPAACASAPASPAPWSWTRRSSSATSRTPASTRSAPPTCRSSSSTSTRRSTRRCSSSPTTSTSRRPSPTTWACCSAATSSPSARARCCSPATPRSFPSSSPGAAKDPSACPRRRTPPPSPPSNWPTPRRRAPGPAPSSPSWSPRPGCPYARARCAAGSGSCR